MAEQGVQNINSKSEYTQALSQDGVMVIDCFAEWCGPCKMISPKVVEFAKKYPKVRFYKVDVDAVSDVAQELGIRAMPTFKIFKGGDIADSVVGASPDKLEEAIQKAASL